MTTEILFMRHGESIVNKTRTISNRTSDYTPLTELGRRQTYEFLSTLQDRRIKSVYASPLTRAKETAEIIAERFGLEIQTEDALREPDCGEIEGRSDEVAWEIHAAQEAAWKAGKHEYRIPGGESFHDVQDRFIPFVNRIVSKYKGDPGSVMIVSHGSMLINMLPLIVSNIQTDFACTNPLGNCSYIAVTTTQSGLMCAEWAGKPITLVI